MDHVAIMQSKVGLIDRILTGEKTIESRWLKNKSSPWMKVFAGDKVYFKDSGGMVRAEAEVEKVEYIDELNLKKVGEIVKKYGSKGKIDLINSDYKSWAVGKNYCVLIWLDDPHTVMPFSIIKSGFGSGAAWISVGSIEEIKAPGN